MDDSDNYKKKVLKIFLNLREVHITTIVIRQRTISLDHFQNESFADLQWLAIDEGDAGFMSELKTVAMGKRCVYSCYILM